MCDVCVWCCICVIHPSLNAESYYLVIEKQRIRARWNTAHTHTQNNCKALDSNRIAHIKTQFFVLVKYESFLFLSYIWKFHHFLWLFLVYHFLMVSFCCLMTSSFSFFYFFNYYLCVVALVQYLLHM